MIKPNTHPTHKGLNSHTRWLWYLTLIIVTIFARSCYLEKKENYQLLWKIQADHEVRIKALEAK